MIPKIIHYCWFGGNPKPALAIKCMKSWKKYCKDYEIMEWNEETFSIDDAPLYVRQAYEAKKWAFVTDYVRLYAMVNYGGIYMDTDVEVIKPLDSFLEHKAFSGFENETNIPTGIMACEKHFPLFVDLLHYYDDVKFVMDDGSYNMTTNVDIITSMCIERGLKQNNIFQEIDGFALYPRDVFCPGSPGSIDVKKATETVTIHWFAGSWMPEELQKERKEWVEYQKNRKKQQQIKKIKRAPKKIVRSIIGDEKYDSIKNKLLKIGDN